MRIQSKSIDGLGREEVGADVGLPAREDRVLVLAARVVAGRGEVHAADAAVEVQAVVGDVVLALLGEADLGGPGREAVLVDLRVVAAAVVDDGGLGGQADHREVLPVEVGDVDVVVAQLLADVVQAAVGVLLDPAEPG
jgi:hypothetical protein